ncbi:MAG: hypothetical protein F9K32_17980 [Desulfobulbaceae bacterium]|nr:MAG: hypothetical protein F9K32_17980 [Desulfobulbaceae bacterium]
MKKKIPPKIYLKIAVGFFFSSIILWYFSFRLLTPLIAQTGSMFFTIGVPIILSILICSLLVKTTIKKELENINEPFSIVARNPNIEIPKEKLTLKILLIRSVISVVIAILLTLPFTIISILKTLAASPSQLSGLVSNLYNFIGFYIFFAIFSIFGVLQFIHP